MAQFTGSRKVPPKRSSKSLPTSPASSPVRDTPPTLQGVSTDRIAKYCCSLWRSGTKSHGSGFIVKLEGLRSAKLIALDQGEKKIREKEGRKKIGELETDYVLVTSHDTIPGSSLSGLKGWTILCNGIELALSELVCGFISCCGSESLFAGHTAGASILLAHDDASCDIQLNITVLFLNEQFTKLHKLQEVQKSGVSPPTVSVEQCLDQEKYTREYEQIVRYSGDKNISRHTHFCIYHFDENRCIKTTPISVVEWQGTSKQSTTAFSVEQQDTLEHQQVIHGKIRAFESLQKLELSGLVETECHGSPVAYINPDTNESSVIGVHVGDTDKRGHCVMVTLHGILRLLQGGLIPVLSALHCFIVPKAWVSRWAYLVTPHIDQMEGMEIDYLCEVLHYLLRERLGTTLVRISVDLVDKDNEASFDLLCALFKHFKNADSITKSDLRNIIDGHVTQLCKYLIDQLKLCATKESTATDRTSLAEKCCKFYEILLDIKHAHTGLHITEQMLCTFQNLYLLKYIRQKYTHSGDVQESTDNIIWKCFQSLENWYKDITEEKRQIGLELQEACMKLAKEKEQHEQCRRELEETHRELIRLRKALTPETGHCNWNRRTARSYPGASTSRRNPSVAEDALVEEPQVHLDSKPTLPQLLSFPGSSGNINIPEKIGTNFNTFGILLLNDETGVKVEAITNNQDKVTDICLNILSRWLRGEGMQPLKWTTLINVLRKSNLGVLADEIEHAFES